MGNEDKPSLVAWVIKNKNCKNPIILLDELEKVEEGNEVQKELIKTFWHIVKMKAKNYLTLITKEIKLDHITFFATVNYPKNYLRF